MQKAQVSEGCTTRAQFTVTIMTRLWYFWSTSTPPSQRHHGNTKNPQLLWFTLSHCGELFRVVLLQDPILQVATPKGLFCQGRSENFQVALGCGDEERSQETEGKRGDKRANK